jgi:AcrR family transcriptional regulator
MGTRERKEREKEMRQQQILNAAKKVFSAKGFRGATMEDIAREAELSPGTLYTYFNKKEDLYASLNVTILERMIQKQEVLRGRRDLDSAGKVRALMDIFLEVYESEPLIFTSLFNLQSSGDYWNLSKEVFSKINELTEKSVKSSAGILEECLERKDIVEYHPMVLTDIIWALFAGLVLWEESKRRSDPKKDFLRKTAESAMEIFLHGVVLRP